MAINARAAMRVEIGGVERVARELAAHLPLVAPGRYRVIAPRPALAHKAGHPWEQFALPWLARGSELILSPANVAPLASRRSVVMIFDLAPFQGRWYTGGYTRWHRFLLPRVARRARLVLTASETVRDELAERFDVGHERSAAVPLGVDPRFSTPGDPSRVRTRLGLDGPYVLSVGTDLPRKNLALLGRIAPSLADRGLEVVHAGSTRPYMAAGGHGLRSLGYVHDADLPALYAGADVFAMPSRYEGFGLPCIEAMAAGTPVVSSTGGALPETCGDAALLVDADDEEGFARAIMRAAESGSDRDRLVEAGRERAKGFTWQRSAEAVDRRLETLISD